jgi:hypothetical protein
LKPAVYFVRAAFTGTLVGVLVLGIGGRLAMRLVALLTHQTPHFGIGASLGILFIGGVLGTLAGVFYGVIPQRRWTDHPTFKAVLFGSALFAMLVLTQPPAIRSEVVAARAYWWAIIPLFWAVCLAYAFALTRRLSTQTSGRRRAASNS